MNDEPYTPQEIRERWHSLANTLQEIKDTQEIAKESFLEHQRDDHERFASIDAKLEEVMELLRPVSSTYSTVLTLGKWGKIALAFLLLVLSIGVAFKALIGK